MRALVLLLALLTACASSPSSPAPPAPPPLQIQVNPSGLSLEEQQAATAYVTSTAASSGLDLRGWTVTVAPYPVALPAPMANPFNPGQTITTATSYTTFGARLIALSWRRDGKTNAGDLDVEDLVYELANARCSCESGLAPASSVTGPH